MSVVSVSERLIGKGGSEKEDGTRTYKRTFLVTVNSVHDGAVTVLSDPRLPQVFDLYMTQTESMPNAWCIGRDPQQIGPLHWEVTCNYGTVALPEAGEPDSGGGDPDSPIPENWGIKIGLTFELFQEPFIGKWVDDVWKPFVPLNSAGEPYDPPPMVDQARPVLSYDGAVLHFNLYQALDYMNSVNNDVFFGASPRQFKMMEYSTSGVEYKTIGTQTIRYYPVKLSMHFKRETWDVTALDQGSYFTSYVSPGETLPASGAVPAQSPPKRKAFLTDEGQPYIGLLNGNGMPLQEGDDPVYRTCRHYHENSFGVLALPQSFY